MSAPGQRNPVLGAYEHGAEREPQQTEFDKLKKMVTHTPVLYYILKEEVTLQCDASQSGLGGALMQNGQPIAYTSRALTLAETLYAQIEKELLAIVFACDCSDANVHDRVLVKYKKGREMLLADTLSHAYLPEVNPTEFLRELQEVDQRT